MMQSRTISAYAAEKAGGDARATKLTTVFAVLIYAAITIIPIAYALDMEINNQLLVVLVALQIGRITSSSIKSSLDLTFSSSFIFLYAYPSISIMVFYDINPLPIVAFFIIFSDIFFKADSILSKNSGVRPLPLASPGGSSDYYRFIGPIISALFISIFLGLITEDPILQFGFFIFPFLMALSIFEEMMIRNPPNGIIYFAIAAFIFAAVANGYFFWAGGGRLVFAAYFLMPVFISLSYKDIGLKNWQIALFAPVMFFIAQFVRYGGIESAASLFTESAAHHLMLSQDLLVNTPPPPDDVFNQFFGQFGLLFLNWIPRAWWFDKPVGLGALSVDDWFGRAGYGDNFSISLGMFGEQIYLLGGWFILGVIACGMALLAIRYYLRRLFPGRVAHIAIFDASLIAYFWGGGSTFGTRFWFIIPPVLVSIWLMQRVFSGGQSRRQ